MSLPMLHSPQDVARTVLVAVGIGTDPDTDGLWPVFSDDEPQSPDSLLTVYGTSPRADGRSMVDGEAWYHYGLQVRVRGEDPAAAYAKAEAVLQKMTEGVYNVTVDLGPAEYVLHCFSGATLLTLGKLAPASMRFVYVINCFAPVMRTR